MPRGTLTGLMDATGRAGCGRAASTASKRWMVADLRGDRVAEHPRDPGAASQERHVLVVGAQRFAARVGASDLAVEVLDQARGSHRSFTPRLRDLQPIE